VVVGGAGGAKARRYFGQNYPKKIIIYRPIRRGGGKRT